MENNNWVTSEILDKVINSTKFNGVVYAEKKGNYYVFGIYLDSKYTYICRDKNYSTKKEIEAELSINDTRKGESYQAKGKCVDQTKVFGTLDWLYDGMNAE